MLASAMHKPYGPSVVRMILHPLCLQWIVESALSMHDADHLHVGNVWLDLVAV
jgi:hypothetical protein